MNMILITTLVITAVGALIGTGLVFMGKKFHAETDPRETAVREALPGSNCGACGYAGCDAMAAAVAKGEAPVNGCLVGGMAVTEKLAAIMDASAEPAVRRVAFVRCKGTCDVTKNQGNYLGIPDCRSAALSGLAISECGYGCLGLGTCAKVCPQNAIRIVNGVAEVDRRKCVGCELCANSCPRGLIELIPADSRVAVACSNRDKGPQVKQVCAAGCIGCTLCVKQCESGAIAMDGNLARVDYAACTQCGKCVEKCPVKVITPPVARSGR